MAGHSKWANIKRQKARVDAVKGKTFTQISRAIIVAARNGVPDPNANFQLRAAVDKAKAAGIPNDNIDRAIAKGAGKWTDGSELEAIQYEGYGPGGVAILIEALTDNRNRTAADLRAAFSKNGGNLGETGCVGWMFDQKGVITVQPPVGPIDEERLLDICLDADAESYDLITIGDDEDTAMDIFTATSNLENATQVFKDQGYILHSAEARWIPNNSVEVSDSEHARSLLKLMETLESLDDVQNVTANFEMTEELMVLSYP
jgi:YebC/PmpR family DNA-binding regulatory protein